MCVRACFVSCFFCVLGVWSPSYPLEDRVSEFLLCLCVCVCVCFSCVVCVVLMRDYYDIAQNSTHTSILHLYTYTHTILTVITHSMDHM